MQLRLLALAGCVTVMLPADGRSQSSGQVVRVTGLAYDSVTARPLPGAFITIVGAAKHTTTDARGRFQFDSVQAGTYRFAMQHAVLDSMGLTGMVTRAPITDGRTQVNIAIPSFRTLWRTACGASQPPRDSGFVYGTILSAQGRGPVASARVDITWMDIVLDETRGPTRRRWRNHTVADSSGSYSLCGIPHSAIGLRIQANADSIASGLIELPPRDVRVQRRDLRLGRFEPDSARRGTVRGVLTDNTGKLLSNVRVLMDDVPEVKSDVDGQFTIQNVPTGTRQIEILSSGTIISAIMIVDVVPGDTVTLAPQLARLAASDAGVLGALRLSNMGEEFVARRRTRVAQVLDSSDILRYRGASRSLANFPHARVEIVNGEPTLLLATEGGGTCIPEVRIDDFEAGYGHLRGLYASELAAMELYARPDAIPRRFRQVKRPPPCGLLLVWTKSAFK